MQPLFPKWVNRVPPMLAAGLLGALAFAAFGYWYWVHPAFWREGYQPTQPVFYSHQLHAGELGIDCRYCHSHVEESYAANVPATATCMNCHTVVNSTTGYLKKATSADGTSASAHWVSRDLARVRQAYASGLAIEWRRVHNVPDYAHFPHSVHLKAGVSCYSCHGRIDEMPVVYHAKPLNMGFCLECHRNPEKYLVDTRGLLSGTPGTAGSPPQPVRITDLGAVEARLTSANQVEFGSRLKELLKLNPPQNCSACHY